MQRINRGILIAVEGIDGSGKSTLCTNLASALSCLASVVLTKEPGGTPLGKQLREIVQHVPDRCAKTEFLLFAADRAQHFHAKVLPALTENKLVISDRMADSSLVYQGYGRGLDHTMIKHINAWAMNHRKPDITIYVRISLAIAQERINGRNQKLTTFEKEKHSFQQTLLEGFDDLYADRDDVIIVDGAQQPDAVCDEASTKIITLLTQRGELS